MQSDKGPTPGANVVVRLSRAVYTETAVRAAAHRLTGVAYVTVREPPEGTEWEVCIQASSGLERLDALAGQFSNDAMDQVLREQLAQETKAIRAVIIAQAFSRANLLHPELDSDDPFADPLRIGNPDPSTGREHQ